MAMSVESRQKISKARKRYWRRVRAEKRNNPEQNNVVHRSAPEYITHRGFIYRRHARILKD